MFQHYLMMCLLSICTSHRYIQLHLPVLPMRGLDHSKCLLLNTLDRCRKKQLMASRILELLPLVMYRSPMRKQVFIAEEATNF